MGFIALGACSLDSTYVCTTDTQCNDGARAGRCELDGYCSFDDEACASGRRYGRWASTSLAGVCVDTTASATSTASSSTGPPTSSTSLDTASVSTSASEGTTAAATLDPSSSSSSAISASSDSSSTGSVVLDPDLIAWYRFDALEGGAVVDSSGNGHVAACESCPALIDGVYGSAVDLNGETTWTVAYADLYGDRQRRATVIDIVDDHVVTGVNVKSGLSAAIAVATIDASGNPTPAP